jgi:hypothetical protein
MKFASSLCVVFWQSKCGLAQSVAGTVRDREGGAVGSDSKGFVLTSNESDEEHRPLETYVCSR